MLFNSWCRSVPCCPLSLHLLPVAARGVRDQQMQRAMVKLSAVRLMCTAARTGPIQGGMRAIGMPAGAARQSAAPRMSAADRVIMTLTGAARQGAAPRMSAAGRVIMTPKGATGRLQDGVTGKGHLPGAGHVIVTLTGTTGHLQGGVTGKGHLASMTMTGITCHLQGGATGKDHLSGTDHLSSMEQTGATAHLPTTGRAMASQTRLSGTALAGQGSRCLTGCTRPPLL